MPQTHLRQSIHWSDYMQTIQWQIHPINNNIAISRKIPLLNKSIIKIPRPHHPLDPITIDKLAKETNALSIIIEPPIHDINNSDLLKHGFRQSKTAYAQSATMHLDISKSESEILAAFSENARRQIKKATKNNIEIKKVSFQEKIDEQAYSHFWNLWENLCDMKHFYKLSKTEMHDKLIAHAPVSHMLFAYHPTSSSPIAVVWYVAYDQIIYYLHTGITKQGYTLAANYLLVWEGIKLGKILDTHTFDFEGLYDARLPQQTKRWQGFSEFKSRFHGKEIYYPLPLIKTYNPIFTAFVHLGEALTQP